MSEAADETSGDAPRDMMVGDAGGDGIAGGR